MGETATHHIVLQDDVLLADGFFEQVEEAAAAVAGEAIAFYEGWEGRNSGVVRLAALVGAQWAYAIDEHVPSLALLLPAEVVRGYEEFAARHGDGWPYDVVIQRYLKTLGVPVRLAVPCTVDHDDVPSLAGNSKHGWRRATFFTRKTVEVTSYDCASFDVVPFYQYGESKCAVRAGRGWEVLDTDRYLRRTGLAGRCDADFPATDASGLPENVRRQVWLTAFATGVVVAGLTSKDPDPETAASVMSSLGPGGLCEEYTGAELLPMIPRVRDLALIAFESGRAALPYAERTGSAASVLVSGGDAALGAHLARLLTDAGRAARYAGRLGGAGADGGTDVLIHLGTPDGDLGNVTETLADAGKLGVRRLIHVGSAAVYRGAGAAQCAEDALSARPTDALAGAWWDGEDACRRWGARTGIPVQVVRLAEQVGPYAPLSGVLATWMLQAWTRRPITLVEERVHQAADHRDLADALVAVLAGPVRSPVYNVASARYDQDEFAELAAETARRTHEERATGTGEPRTPLMSTELITTDTGWRPSAPVRNGAQAQAQWLACDTHGDIPAVTGAPQRGTDA